MDRFKFRVFDLRESKYLDIPAYITQDGKLVDKTLEEDWFDGGYVREIATGKKDTNGKLIYEHDYVMKNKIIYKVFWNKTKISLANILTDDIIDLSETEKMEIIGNEHEETNIREI